MFLMRAKDLVVGSEIYLMRLVVDSQNIYWLEKKKKTTTSFWLKNNELAKSGRYFDKIVSVSNCFRHVKSKWNNHAFISKSCNILLFSVLHYDILIHLNQMFREQPKCLISEDFDNVTTLLKCKKSGLFAIAPQKFYSSWKKKKNLFKI